MPDDELDFVTSLDYVRMHCVVAAWVHEASDPDEHERLADLAGLYLCWAAAAAEKERQTCLMSLAPALRAYLDEGGRAPTSRGTRPNSSKSALRRPSLLSEDSMTSVMMKCSSSLT